MDTLHMDKYELRRRALQRLVDHLGHGGITRVANAIGKEPSYVSRMLYTEEKKGKKRIGEGSVDQLNAAFPGWLESGDVVQIRPVPTQEAESLVYTGADSWPFHSISRNDVERLPAEEKNRLEGAIGLAIAQLGLKLPVSPPPEEQILPPSKVSRLDAARSLMASVQAGGAEAANDPGFVEIRRAAVRVSAGVRGFTADIVGSEFNGSIYLPRAVIEKHHYSVDALVATTVTGDSMAPRISEHDVLLMNTADTERKVGQVYGFNHGGQFLVKRLAYRLKRWYLDSDNAAYDPVLAEEDTFIVGRVVMMTSNNP